MVLHQKHQPVGLAGVLRVMDQDLRPGDGLDPRRQGRLVEAHQTEEIELIGDGDGGHARLGRGLDQGLDAQQTIHQGILAVDMEMDEGGRGSDGHAGTGLMRAVWR